MIRKEIRCEGKITRENDKYFGEKCGRVMAYETDEGIELKCPRCNKILYIFKYSNLQHNNNRRPLESNNNLRRRTSNGTNHSS